MLSHGPWPSKDGDCFLPLPAFLTGTDGRIETHQIGDHRGLPPLEEATKRGIQICSYVNMYIYIYLVIFIFIYLLSRLYIDEFLAGKSWRVTMRKLSKEAQIFQHLMARTCGIS